MLRQGTDRLGGAVDLDALEAYLTPSLTSAPVDPPALDRIDVVPYRREYVIAITRPEW